MTKRTGASFSDIRPLLEAGTPPCAPGDRGCLKEHVKRLPRDPGVYQWRGRAGEVLYIGKAVDLRSRTLSYLTGQQQPRSAAMLDQAVGIDYIVTNTEKEALILEQTLIKRERPRYNVRLTDDKKYPYIQVTDDEFPRVVYTRETNQSGVLFGPFPDAGAAKAITRLLNRSFKLRQCRTLPTRACIYHQMGQCLAPCIQAVPDEVYKQAAEDARSFLAGGGRGLVKELYRRMRDQADAERFEEAARLRDTAQAVESVLERQQVFAKDQEDRDVVAIARSPGIEARAAVVVLFVRGGNLVGRESYFLSAPEEESDEEVLEAFCSQYHGSALAVPREIVTEVEPGDKALLESWLGERRGGRVRFVVPERGERRRLLGMARRNAELLLKEDTFKRQRDDGGGVPELQHLLGMRDPPRSIDGFDISHHGGQHTVASMVRFLQGRPDKQMYRHFRVRDVEGIDDTASIHAAVKRRFEGLVKRGDELPDLVLIDGGKGQLNAARRALAELGLGEQAVCSLAKREEEIYLPRRPLPVTAPPEHPGRRLLERVRDEAHRFAVRYQDKLKRGSLTKSGLSEVPGVGPKRLRMLLVKYGSVRSLSEVRPEDLATTPGITLAMAKQIVETAKRESDR
jgi:excinuclease ABC subunit C